MYFEETYKQTRATINAQKGELSYKFVKSGGTCNLGPFKNYVRSEGGRGYPRTRTKTYKGEGGFFKERKYACAIFTR